MEEKIVKVLNVMSEYLSIAQMKKLQEVILQTFAENEAEKAEIANDKFLEMFLDAKTIEGVQNEKISIIGKQCNICCYKLKHLSVK